MLIHILEQTRQKNKLSKEEMIRRLGICKSYYSMLLKGKRGISKNIAFRLQEEFEVPLDVSLRPKVHAVKTKALVSPPLTVSCPETPKKRNKK